MKALFDSAVRTFVPIVVGGIITWFVSAGIALDSEFEGLLTNVIFGLATGAYYIGARLLETYVEPRFGWLLGLAKQPVYVKEVAS
jgi:hypothetical protein